MWDQGSNFIKFIDQGNHRGASHRGTWTGCICISQIFNMMMLFHQVNHLYKWKIKEVLKQSFVEHWWSLMEFVRLKQFFVEILFSNFLIILKDYLCHKNSVWKVNLHAKPYQNLWNIETPVIPLVGVQSKLLWILWVIDSSQKRIYG